MTIPIKQVQRIDKLSPWNEWGGAGVRRIESWIPESQGEVHLGTDR